MLLNILLLISGIALSIMGFKLVREVDKSHPLLHRLSSAVITTIGICNIWGFGLFTIPVLTDKNLYVMDTGNSWALIDINYHKIRSCTLIGSTAYMEHNGVRLQAPTFPILEGYEDIKHHQTILLIIQDVPVNKFKLELTYRCPFNIIKVENFHDGMIINLDSKTNEDSKDQKTSPSATSASAIPASVVAPLKSSAP